MGKQNMKQSTRGNGAMGIGGNSSRRRHQGGGRKDTSGQFSADAGSISPIGKRSQNCRKSTTRGGQAMSSGASSRTATQNPDDRSGASSRTATQNPDDRSGASSTTKTQNPDDHPENQTSSNNTCNLQKKKTCEPPTGYIDIMVKAGKSLMEDRTSVLHLAILKAVLNTFILEGVPWVCDSVLPFLKSRSSRSDVHTVYKWCEWLMLAIYDARWLYWMHAVMLVIVPYISRSTLVMCGDSSCTRDDDVGRATRSAWENVRSTIWVGVFGVVGDSIFTVARFCHHAGNDEMMERFFWIYVFVMLIWLVLEVACVLNVPVATMEEYRGWARLVRSVRLLRKNVLIALISCISAIVVPFFLVGFLRPLSPGFSGQRRASSEQLGQLSNWVVREIQKYPWFLAWGLYMEFYILVRVQLYIYCISRMGETDSKPVPSNAQGSVLSVVIHLNTEGSTDTLDEKATAEKGSADALSLLR